MRKLIALALAGAMVASLGASPAIAKKKKKTVTEEWTAQALPNPGNTGSASECGVEMVHFTTHDFSTPGAGQLDVRMNNFQADWDLYVTDGEGNELGSSTGFVEATEERVVIPLPKGQDIVILACNYAGGPTASLQLTYTYKG